jgi:hypothetical protein
MLLFHNQQPTFPIENNAAWIPQTISHNLNTEARRYRRGTMLWGNGTGACSSSGRLRFGRQHNGAYAQAHHSYQVFQRHVELRRMT